MEWQTAVSRQHAVLTDSLEPTALSTSILCHSLLAFHGAQAVWAALAVGWEAIMGDKEIENSWKVRLPCLHREVLAGSVRVEEHGGKRSTNTSFAPRALRLWIWRRLSLHISHLSTLSSSQVIIVLALICILDWGRVLRRFLKVFHSILERIVQTRTTMPHLTWQLNGKDNLVAHSAPHIPLSSNDLCHGIRGQL